MGGGGGRLSCIYMLYYIAWSEFADQSNCPAWGADEVVKCLFMLQVLRLTHNNIRKCPIGSLVSVTPLQFCFPNL